MSRRDMVHLPNWVGLRSRNMAFFAAVFFLILTDLLIKPVGIPLPTMTTSYEPLNANPISSSTFNVSGIDMGILLHRWDLDDVFHLSEPVFTDWHSLEAAYLGWRIGRHQSTFCRNQWAALGLIISRPSELTDPKLGWLGPQGAPDLRVHIHMIHQIWRTCFDPAWCGMLDAGLSSEDMWPSVLVRWIHSSCQELLSALASSPGALEGSGPVPVPVPVAGTYCTAGVWLCDVVHRLYRFTTSVLESFTLNRRLAYSLLPGPLSLLFHMFTEPLVFVGLTFVASFGLAYAACSQRRLVKGRQQLQQRLAMVGGRGGGKACLVAGCA
ncbi:hypothetical protein Vretimale_6774 [Volvox reticuliferus]|uniref:Uncharacterized protein n=1 Tax=Volvox reticuliferus TaxID=1737510 RepID=A0A8J4LLJ0_9CHLO|nr:hypothetical protein Vretimale_6774 [Volvox reticuliferus]